MRTNYHRMRDAVKALRSLVHKPLDLCTNDLDDVITDHIANLLHLAAQAGIDTKSVLRKAAYHFEEEK